MPAAKKFAEKVRHVFRLLLFLALGAGLSLSIRPIRVFPLTERQKLDRLIWTLWDADDSGTYGAAVRLGKSGDPRAVAALLAASKDEDSMVRHAGATGLGYVHDPRATEALLDALQDERTCEAASFSLCRLNDPNSVGPVLEILQSPSTQVRAAAVRAISRAKDPRAVSALYAALSDPEEALNTLAMRAIGEYDDSRSLDVLLTYLGNGFALGGIAKRALANRADGKGVDAILGIISDPNSKTWREALIAISDCTEFENTRKLVLALCEMLEHGTTEIQIRAADGLGHVPDMTIENERAVEVLLKKIRSPNREVRWACVRGLRYRPGNRAFKTMLAFAADTGSEFHREGLFSMWSHKNPRAFETLIRCINEKDEVAPTLASYCLTTLAEARLLDSADAAETLAAAASIHNPVLARRAALGALVKIRHLRAIVLMAGILKSETDREARKLVSAALARSDVPGMEMILAAELQKDATNTELETLLTSIKNERRRKQSIPPSIIRTLGQSGDDHALSVFTNELRPLNVSMEEITMRNPPLADSDRTLHRLLSGLHNPEHNNFAAAALGVLGDRRAVKPLIALLKPPLLRFRFSESPDVFAQAAAAAALGCLGDRRAVPVLMAALAGTSPRISTAAAIALGQLRDQRAVVPLIHALEYEHRTVREAAARALGEICDGRAIDPLKSCLSSFPVAPAAASSLATLGWHPQTERERVHVWVALDQWDRIEAHRDTCRTVLMRDLAGDNPDAVENAALALIAIGEEDAIPGIIGALSRGNLMLATLYYNSGRPDLQRAASKWLRESGEMVDTLWQKPPALIWAGRNFFEIRTRPDLWLE